MARKPWKNRVRNGKKRAELPVYHHEPRNGSLYMKRDGLGDSVKYQNCRYCTERLRWASREDPHYFRAPKPMERRFLKGTPFMAAGQLYTSFSQLFAMRGDAPHWYKDAFGREVFAVIKRYPCFDEYDAANENRYYRWYFICQDEKLTRIFVDDDQFATQIYVTEDVRDVEDHCWQEMKENNFFG